MLYSTVYTPLSAENCWLYEEKNTLRSDKVTCFYNLSTFRYLVYLPTKNYLLYHLPNKEIILYAAKKLILEIRKEFNLKGILC